jgi:hypothetical protein
MADITTETSIAESRKDVIAAAVAAVDKTEEKKEESKEEKVVPDTPKETAEEKAVREADDAALVAQGKELIQALKDPARAPIVIDFLAKQAGYTKGEVKAAVKDETKAEELHEDVISFLKESLGPEFDFLADKIGKGLEKYFDKALVKSQEDIRAEFQRQEQEKLQNQSATALTRLTEGFFGTGAELPDNVTNEMSKYMDRVQPSPDTSVKDYIEDAFNASVMKLGLSKTDKAKQERTNRNRTDASSRLASDRVPAEEVLHKDNSKPLNRRDAIEAAVAALEKG